MKLLQKELDHFSMQARPMRMLLLTNMVYALVLPLIELFISAYIIRNAADFSLVMIFQLAQGAGIPLTFMLNAWLLRRFNIAHLYATGMILSGVTMGVIMLFQNLTVTGISVTGFCMGFSYGFFWANRVFLSLTSTNNQNRNYYYGIESFFFTGAYILMPLLAGYFIASSQRLSWFDIDTAYRLLTVLVILLAITASVLAQRGGFRNPAPAPFLFFRFHRLWRKMLGMAVLKGLAQGFIVTAPVMLVMKLIGNEGKLGIIQSATACLSAFLLYLLGRASGPQHRMQIFTAGLLLFLLGTTVNMTLYSALGVFVFVTCQAFARPLLDLAYFPVQLGVTECVSAKEKRNPFAYIFSHELGLFAGRLVGCGAFIVLSRSLGEDVALRYALAAVALLQTASVFLVRSIMTDPEWCEPEKSKLGLNALKEPAELEVAVGYQQPPQGATAPK